MDRSPKQRQTRSAPVLTMYVVVWLAGALLSFGYLTALLIAPQWLEEWTPALVGGDPVGNRGERAPARLTVEIEALRTVVTKLQAEVDDLRLDASQRAQRESALNEQLAVLRQQVDPEITADTPEIPADKAVDAEGDTVLPDVINEEPEVARSRVPAKPKNVKPTNEVETGSVGAESSGTTSEKKAETKISKASPEPSTTRPVQSTSAGVFVSTADSVHGLRIAWGLLSERYMADLGQLQPRYTVATRNGKTQYDLIAGPIASKKAAIQVCNNLKERGLNCAVSSFTGNAL